MNKGKQVSVLIASAVKHIVITMSNCLVSHCCASGPNRVDWYMTESHAGNTGPTHAPVSIVDSMQVMNLHLAVQQQSTCIKHRFLTGDARHSYRNGMCNTLRDGFSAKLQAVAWLVSPVKLAAWPALQNKSASIRLRS